MTSAVATQTARPLTANHSRPGPDFWIALTLTLLTFAYYLLIMGGHQYSIDGATTFQAARTLVTQHSFRFDPPLQWDRTITTSKYGIGLSLAYTPFLFVLQMFKPALVRQFPVDDGIYPPELLYNPLYTLSSWLNPLIVALTIACVYLLARELGLSPRWSAIGALVTGLASPLTVYARFDFTQPLIALCLVAPLWLILRAGRRPDNYKEWLGAGVVMGYGVLTRFDYLTVVPWLCLLAFSIWREPASRSRRKRLKNSLLLISPIVLAVLVALTVNIKKFGSPFDFGYAQGTQLDTDPTGLFGLSISPGKGMLFFYPLTILLIFGIAALWRDYRRFAIVLTGMLATQFLFYSFYVGWWGGWGWGPRYLVPLVPLITLVATYWAAKAAAAGNRMRQLIFGGLVALSFVISLNGVLFDFLAFYSNLYFRVLKAGEGEYEHFSFVASPLFGGWKFFDQISTFDLFWLRRIKEGSRGAMLTFAALGSLIVASAFWLRRLVHDSENALSAVDS